MKYIRLTYKDNKLDDYIPVEQVETWDEFADRFYNFCDRLGELEDKIENGELVEVEHCENETEMHPVDEFVCSSCGLIMRDISRWEIDFDADPIDESQIEFEIKFCPRCGRKVVEETESFWCCLKNDFCELRKRNCDNCEFNKRNI